MTEEKSEFGAGVVVCLAKFSEHLWNDHVDRIRDAERWSKMDADAKARERGEAAAYPSGDAAKRMMNVEMAEHVYDGADKAISRLIEMWMNGASDHFYDLDREKAPPTLIELADLTLRIGHGFTGETWTMDHFQEIRDLWRRACLEVDALLNVKADWGEW